MTPANLDIQIILRLVFFKKRKAGNKLKVQKSLYNLGIKHIINCSKLLVIKLYDILITWKISRSEKTRCTVG